MSQKQLRKLPIGIQNFEQLRTNNYVYIDKTKDVYELVTQGTAYFLSRPRRFGKSLLCSTFKALFEGKKHLFENTWIASSDWEWQAHPIIYLSFAELAAATPEELYDAMQKALRAVAKPYNLTLEETAPGAMLAELVRGLKIATSREAVILIDEYDKPIINNLQNLVLVDAYRTLLKQFYGPIKDLGAQLRFLFITGVSQFTQVSIFSDLNHLEILSSSSQAATVCGYTEQEIVANFPQHITQLSNKYNCSPNELLAQVKHWYNGYSFTDPAEAPERVYNPFSVINFFKQGVFKNYWFKTGTPTFVINYFKNHNFIMTDFEGVMAKETLLSSLLPEQLNLTTLLYQTGYLTIKSYSPTYRAYTLGFPNAEVAESCSEQLFELVMQQPAGPLFNFAAEFKMAFIEHKLDQIKPALKKICAHLPSTINPNNERGYQMVFYLVLQLMGLDVLVEDPTAIGRIDAVIKINTHAYIIELKIRGLAQQALDQIKEKQYDEKYRAQGFEVTHIGIVFDASPAVRTITEVAIKEQ